MTTPVDTVWYQVTERLREATAGEFVIGRELGRGGFAAVFLAQDVALDRPVAIKVMSPTLLHGEGMVQRFTQEAVMMANLRHPHIITVHRVRQAEDLHFFVMEYVAGSSLERVVRRHGPLPLAIICDILWQVGGALAHAHRRGVVHRDVKPANILIDEEGRALVTDFGIAKAVASTLHTQTGMIIGTPVYMSPEQCYGTPVSDASDQYSLGIVAYEMLTGHPPFEGSHFSVMQAHTSQPVPPPRVLAPSCPPAFEDALLRMLAKDPAQRWPGIREALLALGARSVEEWEPERLDLARLVRETRQATAEHQVPPGAGTPATPATPPTPVTPSAPVTEEPVSIEIVDVPEQVEVGDAVHLGVLLWRETGDLVTSRRVAWSTRDEAIVSVDRDSGRVIGRAPGRARIGATAGALAAEVELTVVPARVRTVEVFLPSAVAHVGDHVRLTATVRDARGAPLATPVAWSSAAPAVAEVSPDGVLTAVAPGEAVVIAEAEGVRGQAVVTVRRQPVADVHLRVPAPTLAEGGVMRLTAVAVDALGSPLPDRSLTWSVRPDRVATVSPDGLLSARAVGEATVLAECEGHSATVKVAVVPRVAASVVLSSPPPDLHPGRTFRLTATALDAHGERLDRPAAWRSDSTRIARVSKEGEVTARSVGRAVIVATVEGVEGSVELVIAPALAPPPSPAVAGAAAAADVSVAGAAPRSRRRALVMGSGAALAVIAAALWVALGGDGRAAARNGAAQVAVTPTINGAAAPAPSVSTPAVLALAPRRASVSVGDSLVMNAVRGGAGAGAAVLWRSIDTTVASVSNSGVVRGRAAGSARVVALSGDLSDTAMVEVTAARSAVARLEATPARLALHAGDTASIVAVPTDASGRALQDRHAAWRSSDARVARVDAATGRVVALGQGRAVLVGRVEGVEARVPISVDPPPALASAPSPPSATSGGASALPPTMAAASSPNAATNPAGGPPASAPSPSPAKPAEIATREVVAGGSSTCAVLEAGGVACWGGGQALPTPVAGGRALSRLTAGASHRCGLAGGTAYCWGSNDEGQLGDGTTTARSAAAPVSGLPGGLTNIAAGRAHTCATDAAGGAWCWGANGSGQLGNGTTRGSPVPVKVRLDVPLRSIAAGREHTCAVAQDGRAFCWGDGFSGAVGNNMKQREPEPFPVEGKERYRRIVAGDEHSCGLTTDGRVYCWGDNRAGQLGDMRSNERLKPTAVARVADVADIAAGGMHTCALTRAGRVFCWGGNAKGQLGDGTTANRTTPGEISVDDRLVEVAAGAAHTCVRAAAGTVLCWGDNARGQVADGAASPQTTPVVVRARAAP